MNKALKTKEKLLINARALLWRYGYSNVPLRQISLAAGVDVALISRYFGGKRGLFEATLEGAFELPEVATPEELVDMVVQIFVDHPRDAASVSILQLMLMNAQDEEVGELVRDAQHTGLQSAIEQVVGDAAPAALFTAVILGISIAEKSLLLAGIAPCGTPQYEAQLRHVLNAALVFKG